MTRAPAAKALEYGLTQAECGKLFGEHTEVWIIHFEKYRKEIACYPFECVHVWFQVVMLCSVHCVFAGRGSASCIQLCTGRCVVIDVQLDQLGKFCKPLGVCCGQSSPRAEIIPKGPETFSYFMRIVNVFDFSSISRTLWNKLSLLRTLRLDFI